MLHRFRSMIVALAQALCICAIVCSSTVPARGQSLAFTPGQASAYAGDPTQSHAQSSASYIGPLNGLVLGNPSSVSFDGDGNAYLVDRFYASGYYAVVRVVASGKGAIPAVPAAGSNPAAGTVYPVAGSSTSGLVTPCAYPGTATDQYGDGCAATNAILSEAAGPAPFVAVDSNGNIYLSDATANEIRVIFGGGSIPGLPANPVRGNIYAIAGNGTAGNSGDGGPALNAELSSPGSVSLDSHGNIFIGDTGNDAVRVLYVGGGANSVPGLPSSAMAGNVYTIAGTLGQSCAYGSDTCGDDGPATTAGFNYNMGAVAVDPSGNIYVADKSNLRIRAIYVTGALPGISNPAVGNIYTVAGASSGSTTFGVQATDFEFSFSSSPSYLAFDPGGEFYISDSDANEVYKVDASGIITVVLGGGTACAAATDPYGDGCATNATTISGPYGLALDLAGNVYVADLQNNLIRKATLSSTSVVFSGPFGLSVTPQVISVSNAGSQPLQLSNLESDTPFSQVATGGSADCASSTLLQPGTTCQIGIGMTPPQAGTLTGTFQVSSNALNATNSQNVINLTANIAQAASSTVLTAAPAVPAQVGTGQPVTFTATVYQQSGVTAIPTGTVSFNNGATVLGTATVNGSGVATFTTSSLPAGSYAVTAVYSGDTDFNTSSSSTTFVAVAASAVPTVTLTASPTSAPAGQSVTLTVTVAPSSGTAVATGTIVFEDGVAPISPTIPLSGGTATFTTTSLPAGSNTLYAVYSGNLPGNGSNAAVVTVSANSQLLFTPGVIPTIAGNYNFGYTGDGGAATSAEVSTPEGLAYDSAGNLYFADGGNNVIRVVASGKKGTIPGIADTQQGFIYTVAGIGGQACATPPCGDGGPANQAYLNGPTGVAVDHAGNLYIADSGDYVIREVAPDGTITTVAGVLGSPASESGDGGLASQATLSGPQAVAVDNSGNLYIAETGNSVVRKVDAQTKIITTIAGSLATGGTYVGDGGPATLAGLTNPQGIAFDTQGNLYIADTNNEIVRKVSAQTGIISTVAGHYYNSYIPTSNCTNNPAICFAGDGGPATQATLYKPTSISVDAAGNLYVVDSGNFVVRMVDAQTGTVNTIAGQGIQPCYLNGPPCGDGGLATSATFDAPFGLTQDSSGNLTVSDSYDSVVRQITAGSTAIDFGPNNYLGTTVGQSVTVTNAGAQPLTITGITASDGFSQAASGGADCTASTSLAPAQQCTIEVQFFPTAAKAYTGTLTVASNSSNAQSGNNTITLSGTGVANSGTQSQTITFTAPAGPYYQGMQIPLGATATSGLPVQYLVSGPGLILNNGTASAALKLTGAGPITVTAYQFGDSTYLAASNNGATVSFTAVQPSLIITAQNQSITLGQTVPAYTGASVYAATGFIPGDSATSLSGEPSLSVVNPSTGAVVPVGSTPEAGQYTLAITQGSLVAPSYYKLSFVNGLFTVSGSNQQTVVFQPLPTNLAYGAAPVTLAAVANDAVSGKADGLPITFSTASTTDTISGNLLTVGGAGPVTVTATQAGNSFYASATAMQSVVVAKASLSVTATNQSLAQGVGLPSLSSLADYTFGQFQNQETPAVLTGAPTLTIVDRDGNVLQPGSTPPVGTYTIRITQSSLSSPNYSFNFVNGTFTIVNGQSQTVTFPGLPNLTYGAAPISLGATASSGLGVVYSVTSGPATVAGNLLSIHGVGSVTVTATQAGNSTYAPANAKQSFNVGPALLTVTAADVTRVNNVANPPLTGYSISGYVNGETQAVVSGAPSISTTALPGSPVGTYPIVIAQQPSNSAQNPMVATNYIFSFANGTLTITPGGPTPDYSLTATPAVLGIPQGQLRQTTITLTPTNYYQGTVKLSCGSLPANMTCTFSPSALNPDGTGNPATGTITINTNGAAPVVAGAVWPSNTHVFPTAALCFPGELAALVIALYRRKRGKRGRMAHLLILLILLTGACVLSACGGSSSLGGNSTYTAPGSYTVSLTAADSAGGATHSINLAIDVQ